MVSKPILNIIVMLSLSMSQEIHDRDFCEAFAESGFDIDYGYEHGYASKYLFIGHNYWEIRTTDPLQLDSIRGKSIRNWFGSGYRMAFHINICNHIECQRLTGLLKGNSHTIEWAPIDRNHSNGSYILVKSDDTNRYLVNKSEIAFDSDFRPSLAYGFGSETIFIGQNASQTNLVEYYRTLRGFKFANQTVQAINVSDDIIIAFKKRFASNTNSDQMILNNLKSSRRMVAFFNEFQLFVEKKCIIYCKTGNYLEFLNKECNSEEPKVLINCSHLEFGIQSTSTAMSTTTDLVSTSDLAPVTVTPTNSTLWIWIVIVIVVICLIVVAIGLYFYMTKKEVKPEPLKARKTDSNTTRSKSSLAVTE